MSDLESTLSATPSPPRPSRLRRFFLRHLPLSVGGLVVLLALAVVGAYFVASSARFEGMVRQRLVAALESATGGRVEIASFHWHLLNLEADAGGIVIHGLEDPGEAPLARIEHLSVRISVLDFFAPRILLRALDVSHPALHFIVYPDGSTNQPQPRTHKKTGKSTLDTLFDFQAGHASLEQGVLHYEDRASSFDFQDRYIPLNFNADDVSLRLSYVPAAASGVAADKSSPQGSESYRIEAGATDLELARGGPQSKVPPVHGYLQATLDLTRSAIYLRSLRLTAHGREGKDHALEISAALTDFAHPQWQAKTGGELDMRLLDPIFGYPFAPEGIARLDLASAGNAGEFRTDGNVHIEGGSYIGTGVVATGVRLDLHVHADPRQLLLTSIVARFRQGGEMEGMVDLHPWLPPLSGAAVLAPASHSANRNIAPPPSPPSVIPVNGKVTAALKNVALDTLLEMVCAPPYQRLGLDALLNGPATAIWSNGDTKTVAVTSMLSLSPSGQAKGGEVSAYGTIDGTYTQRDGAVDLRKLELYTPASAVQAHGHLGAYPLASPSAMSVEFHSHNLGEFDTVLRGLGLHRNGKAGTSALPVALGGQVDFLRGTWSGSLASPRLAGNLKATQLSVEMPPAANDKAGQSRQVHFDSVEATGSYSAERIDISQGLLQRGKTQISLKMTLDATPATGSRRGGGVPSFDANSVLHLHLQAGKVGIEDVQPFVSQKLPVEGALDAQLQVDGPIHALGGSGWIELDGGSVYGEPVSRIRATGSIANQRIKLTSVNVGDAAGNITATGSYDLKSRQFQMDAKGTGIDVSRIAWLRRQGLTAAGKLGFSAQGSGTLDDPRLEGRATLSSLALSGVPLGGLEVAAHTANRSVTYDATARPEGAEVKLHGQTALNSDYTTQANLEFARFNIGSLLKLAHVEGLVAESALAGSITVAGPMAHPEQLHGEARLRELAVTVAGVHLKSEGGAHATLANGRILLDPLHVTGENTDMHAQGSLSIKGAQQLDLAASGAVNLKLAETLDSDLTASGTTTFQVEAHGPLKNPGLEGRIDFQNGSLSLEDIPNGLSQLHGTLEFSQNRLVVKSLTAMSGGGLLSVGGYLAYQHGLYADLSVNGKGIRIRYPQGVSSQADATLHLQGAQNNLLLSGNVLITRFTMSSDLDIAALVAQTNAVKTITPPDAPSNHVRLDVHVTSSPQLNFQNAYAKLAGDVDLRLRGTVASPALLGRVSITEGNAIIAGTRYELQSGDVIFSNPVRIEPSIDLNATARVEDYNITLGLHGTLANLAVTYRSDPPLPEADVVALLALGRTESQQRLYTQQQEQTGANPTTDALLGGALNATVSSRVQRLFGAGSVKVDPNYLGALGNSTSRIIVEEQLGRYVTLTYATNVNTTGQQLIQADVAINRHVSLLVSRDESGVFSMVLKATRRYR
ncbi:MAG: translocation/assembly module TamB domain-containing protein [Terracidiphilus sp.]|nr:translocation/assembly module TamB domain-containing protein [Terracidiphilus sp.]